MIGFVHARTFDTRWGVGLAFIDLDDEDCEVMRLQLWAPLSENGDDARVYLSVGLPASASDAAHDAMSGANRSALLQMDVDKFEEAFERGGIARTLDKAFAANP